jgi:hypothetical protein
MALRIVGSGLGRTGTKSMQTALNMIGFGPCHHMYEVLAHRESMLLWIEASKGAPVWDQIFAGYQSMVDYPGAAYWRELAAHYPDAKVLHTTRDPDAWFDSTQATIFSPAIVERFFDGGIGQAFVQSFLGDLIPHLSDRAFMTDHFRRHEAAVKAAIPADRLLVYQVGSGWEPLCDFLGVPAPDEPYPSENTRAEFFSHLPAA